MAAWMHEARELIAKVDQAVSTQVWPWSADDTEDTVCELSTYLNRALDALMGAQRLAGQALSDLAKMEDSLPQSASMVAEFRNEAGEVFGWAPVRSDVVDLTPQFVRPAVCPTCKNTGKVKRRPGQPGDLRRFFDPCPNERWHNPGGEHYLTDQGGSAPVGESFNDSTGGAR